MVFQNFELGIRAVFFIFMNSAPSLTLIVWFKRIPNPSQLIAFETYVLTILEISFGKSILIRSEWGRGVGWERVFVPWYGRKVKLGVRKTLGPAILGILEIEN